MSSASRGPSSGLLGSPAEILRFAASGGAGSAVFSLLYLVLHELALVPVVWNEAFSWSVAYLVTSFLTHHLHRFITFRWDSPYWRSLRRTYVIYATSLAATTVLHDRLVWALGLHHWLSFLASLAVSGCGNYLAFRHWGFRPEDG